MKNRTEAFLNIVRYLKISQLCLLVFFISNILIVNLSIAQSPLVLQPSSANGKDAKLWYLSSQTGTFGPSNTSNFGNCSDFQISEWTWNSGNSGSGHLHQLIEFDLSSIPFGATIDSAFFSLYFSPTPSEPDHWSPSGSNATLIQRVIQPWNEQTVTWNTAPATTTQNQVIMPQSTSLTQDYENLDVSNLIQDIIDNPTTGFGFKLQMQTASYYRRLVFASSDHSDSTKHPKLVVYYNACAAQPINLGNDTLICQTDTLLLDAGNFAASYLWSTGETTQTISVSPLFTTEYYITITDTSACESYDTILVEIANLPISNLFGDTTICYGDSLILIVGGTGTNYYWSTDQYVDSILVTNSGMYYVTISDGCGFIIDSVYVQVTPAPSVNFNNNISFCNGGSAILDAGNPGSNYFWSTGETTQSITVTTSGLYSIVVNNECGFATEIVNINAVPQPIVNLGNDTTICEGDSVFLDAQNTGLSILWSNGDTNQTIFASPGTPTIFSVLVDNFGCSDSDSILITPLPSPSVFLGEDTTVCEKDSIFLDAGNPGAIFLWSDGATNQAVTIMPDFAMTIFVDVAYSGCIDSDTFEIDIFPVPLVNLGNDTVLCEGNTFELNAGNPGNDFFWSTGETSQQITISNLGLYYVAVTNECEDTEGDSINVSLVQNPVTYLGNDTTIGFSQIYTIDAGAGFISYLWSNGQTNQTILVDSSLINSGANYFSVMVTDSNNCSASDSIIIYLTENQVINMQTGWSIISTYMNPFQSNIDSVMNYLFPEIILVKNTNGMVYWPLFGLNNIGDLVLGEGYQIKMNSPQTLVVYGNASVPELSPITILQNWSFIGYLRQSQALIESMLAPIVNEIVIVKNGNGLIYWPSFGINNIVNMIPGEGYQIKTLNSVVFTYLAN
ncbi:MAG: DNRLRE domain-containing protein [Bacteroidetes bacterium]|jgi:hypothetical protein|nr:DNRLRE domain-containing protein [Bacteroidota bacterium]MBT6687593.1 DNRLRE domain-containing protein [Bacteroidota bacterium]MBT7143592.1 DNRLRE domain-containing protein [Bacteroidota bacterium]MBT7492188.1 DNRLRE domain-containing protein [Bacteroidota bacterium]